MRSTPASRRVPQIAVAALLVAAGCQNAVPTASPPPATPTGDPRPAAEIYAGIRTQVIALRGLEPTKAVEPVALDAADLRAALSAEFDRENTPDELRLAEDLLITFGLLPAGTSIRTTMLDFQTGQVAGYYSPDKDELFVVSRSGGLGPTELVTYAHEFTHQLQDQAIDLNSLGLDSIDQSDRQLAHLALVEGDAVSIQSQWMLTNLTPEQLGQLIGSSLDPKALEALQNAPPYIRETAIFPYQDGLAFVTASTATDGYEALEAVYDAPPSSTEQILHPEKYLVREEPTSVTIPDRVKTALGAGWTVAGQDTLGELVLRIWLSLGRVPRAEAIAAAAGWGGDRLVMLRGPNGAVAVGMITTWDTAADATEFQAAATSAVGAQRPAGVVASDGLRTVLVAVGDRSGDVLAALGD